MIINGVQITVGSIATSDGVTYILGEPVPIDEAKKIGYGQKED